MATNPQGAAPMLPPLYKSIMPLSSSQHATYGVKARDNLEFARAFHAIPVTVDEFAIVQRHYPIIFATEGAAPLALVGLREGQNAFLTADGTWRDGCYVPAYVRRYPFILARLRPDSEELTLCFDDACDDIVNKGGEPLFSEGEASTTTKNVLQFCEQFEQSLQRTKAFVDEMTKGGFLIDGEVSIQQEGMEQPAVFRGFKMVAEDKLKELRGDQARKLIQNGALPLMYAHLFSLSLIRDIFSELNPPKTA